MFIYDPTSVRYLFTQFSPVFSIHMLHQRINVSACVCVCACVRARVRAWYQRLLLKLNLLQFLLYQTLFFLNKEKAPKFSVLHLERSYKDFPRFSFSGKYGNFRDWFMLKVIKSHISGHLIPFYTKFKTWNSAALENLVQLLFKMAALSST